jgi:D-psicose/D-tagatose/L-ribulose 3-epimerase
VPSIQTENEEAFMKFGVNTFVWVSPCTTQAVKDLAPKVKSMGFDILEISIENPDLVDVNAVKEILKENQLDGIICGAFGPDRNICSIDTGIQENARKYILWLIEAAAQLGSETVCGPMYSARRNGKGLYPESKKWPRWPARKA